MSSFTNRPTAICEYHCMVLLDWPFQLVNNVELLNPTSNLYCTPKLCKRGLYQLPLPYAFASSFCSALLSPAPRSGAPHSARIAPKKDRPGIWGYEPPTLVALESDDLGWGILGWQSLLMGGGFDPLVVCISS